MRIDIDAANGCAPVQMAPEPTSTSFSTFSSAWRSLHQADPLTDSLDGGGFETPHAYTPMSSMQTVWATPTEYPVDAMTVFPNPPNPPRDCPSRPCPVATPVEFTEIMAKVRAAHDAGVSWQDCPPRPRPVETPVEFTQAMAEVRAAHEREDLRPAGTPLQRTSQRIARPGRIPTPQEVHGIVTRLRERRMAQASGHYIESFAAPPERPPEMAPGFAHAAFSSSLTTVRAASGWVTTNETMPGSSYVPRERRVALVTPSPRVQAASASVDTTSTGGSSGSANEHSVTVEQRGVDPTPRPRRRGHLKVTKALLLRIEALGASGIAAMGGLGAVAKANGTSRNTLKDYISSTGQLYHEGRVRVDATDKFRTGKVTAGLLRSLEKMGAGGIRSRGGLRGIAKDEGIALRTLRGLVSKDGTPSALGRARLDELDPTRRAGKVPVTAELLLTIMRLGASGIRAAGGLRALAARHNVFVSSLRRLINAKGELGSLGKRVVAGERVARIPTISDDLIQRVKALGPQGIKAAGGFAAVARANNVAFNALRVYINTRGKLTPTGRARLYGADPSHTARVTPTLLKEILALGKEGIALEGGLDALASKRRVAPHILRHYVTLGGKLRPPGLAMMARSKPHNASA